MKATSISRHIRLATKIDRELNRAAKAAGEYHVNDLIRRVLTDWLAGPRALTPSTPAPTSATARTKRRHK